MWRQGYTRITYPLTILPTVLGNLTYKKIPFGKADERMFLHFYNDKMELYFDEENENYFYKKVLERIVAEPRFMNKVESKIKKIMKKLLRFSGKLASRDLGSCSNAKLVRLLNKFNDLYARIFGYGLVNTYDRDLVEYVKKYFIDKWGEHSGEHYFTILTSTIEGTYYEKEKKDILATALALRNNMEGQAWHRKAEELEEKYNWLYINYEGELRVKEDFKKLLEEAAANNPAETLAKLEKEKYNLFLEQRKLEKELSADKTALRLASAIRQNAYLREYRKPLAVQAIYYQRSLLNEIASRLRISVKELKFLLPDEIARAFFQGVDKAAIQERMKESVYDMKLNDFQVSVGEEARKIIGGIRNEGVDEAEVEIKGMTACAGFATGKVRLVLSLSDGQGLSPGEIFVGTATSPDLIQFLHKAAAIITDEGGLTSHAAIVSRELKVPCIVGTQNATKIFKTGDLVEVDAGKGIVRKLKK